MKRFFFLLLCLCLSSFPFSKSVHAKEAKSAIAAFDLFTFSLSSLNQPLGERAKALGKALAASFPKEFSENSFKENIYGGFCFNQGDELFRLAWADSETEGFSFSLEKMKDQKSCASPFTEGETFKTHPLDASRFFPISHGHPTLQLGVSTPVQVKAELGIPDYANSEKMIYVLKRNKEKEKNCQSDPKHGDFEAIEIRFDFHQGKLFKVWLNNSIAGEC